MSVHLNSDDGDSIPLDPLDIHIHVPEQKKINIRFPNMKTSKPSQVRNQTLHVQHVPPLDLAASPQLSPMNIASSEDMKRDRPAVVSEDNVQDLKEDTPKISKVRMQKLNIQHPLT